MRKLTLLILAIALLGALAACGGGEAEPTEAPEPAEAPAEAEPAEEEGGELAGQEVTVLGAVIDQDEDRFLDSIAVFEERTGVDVIYEGSGDFEQLATLRIEGGNPPDLIMFPQPGLMVDLARDGALVDISNIVDTEQLSENYTQAWIDLGTVDGTLYGVWYRASLKSSVWYPVPEFEEAGYEFPETWDEMIALSDQIASEGKIPWCIGMESATATGWVGTDWIEDIMLRTAGAEKYDQWVAGELKFDSPEVRRAFELFGEIVRNPDYVLGGTTAVLTTPFGDSPDPMFEDPPGCWMHRQASFITGFFPEAVQEEGIGNHANAFYFPPIDEEDGRPVLGAGDVIAATNDDPATQEFLRFLATPEAGKVWAETGGFLSPNGGVPLEWYPDEITRTQAEILTQADVFRFDGSDLMPGPVGTGAFWTEMVNWVSGQDLDTTLTNIDAAWPEN